MIDRNRIFKWTALFAATAVMLSAAGCRKDEKPAEKDEPPASAPSSDNASVSGSASDANSADYWLGGVSGADAAVMDLPAIESYNRSLTGDSQATRCVDLAAMPDTLDRASLTAMLDEIAPPADERYIGASKATPDYYKKLEENLNRAGVRDSNDADYGFAVLNTVLRTFPTADPSYEFPDDTEFDLFAETMLKIWEPVRVLHASADGKWYLVQSRDYRAWAAADAIGLCSAADWGRYTDLSEPAVVTGNRVTLNENVYNKAASGAELFMGTALPRVDEADIPATIDGMTSGSGCAVYFPGRDGSGRLTVTQALIPHNADVRRGYLPYTRENVLRQAFKMVGDRHGWSGLNKSRDSSALVQDVFSTFGLHLPRNSGQQASLPGDHTDLSGESDKAAAIAALPAGSILTMDGHVALLLGSVDGEPQVLHSIYVAYDDAGNEQIYNAIIVSGLDLHEKDGRTYLDAVNGAVQIR